MPTFGKAVASDKVNSGLVDPNMPRLSDPRTENRLPMNLQGVCESNDPAQPLPCTIVDMSGSGAKIEFSSTGPIPAAFKVYVAALNTILECRVIWREPTQLGVELIASSAAQK